MAFITFEGTDGTGKTTQIKLLAELLRKNGHHVHLTREPGGCPISDKIRSILLDPDNNEIVPTAELLLYAASRAQHVAQVIVPALESGGIVLCDRFTDATMAYQGYGRDLDKDLIRNLNSIASPVTPDLTILFDLTDPSIGIERTVQRAKNDRIAQSEGRLDQENIDFHTRVQEGYRQTAKGENRFAVIDAAKSPEDVAVDIQKIVSEYLSRR